MDFNDPLNPANPNSILWDDDETGSAIIQPSTKSDDVESGYTIPILCGVCFLVLILSVIAFGGKD